MNVLQEETIVRFNDVVHLCWSLKVVEVRNRIHPSVDKMVVDPILEIHQIRLVLNEFVLQSFLAKVV